MPSSTHAAPPVEAPAQGPTGLIAGAALLLFLAAGCASTLWAVATDRLDLQPKPVTPAAVVDGAAMRDMAAALARAPVAAGAAALERQASWLVLRDLGPQVREGCPGWLFLADELRPHPQGDAALATRAQAVVDVRDRLRDRGIALAVVLVPDKSRVAASALCGLHRPAAFAPRLASFDRRLRDAGVPVVDTTAALSALPAPFLRTDTHWSEAGAQAAAQATAGPIRNLHLDLQPVRHWEVEAGAPQRRPGDLVRLAGLDTLPLAWQPRPEEDTRSRFAERPPAPSGTAAAPAAGSAGSTADDLFGDSQLPQVALVGTSFANTSQFVPFLAAALGTPVGNFARDGGDFWGSVGAYVRSPAFRDTPPRLLVWEIPERTLQMPVGTERWTLD